MHREENVFLKHRGLDGGRWQLKFGLDGYTTTAEKPQSMANRCITFRVGSAVISNPLVVFHGRTLLLSICHSKTA
jgi:hypothetical protein